MRSLVVLILALLSFSIPSPGQTPSPTPAALRAKGLDVRGLATPEEVRNLRWQKVLVGTETVDGAALVGLPKNSVWNRLGFKQGDIIIRIDKRRLHSSKDLDQSLNRLLKNKNQTVDFHIIRDNQEMYLNYKLTW